MTDEHSAGSIGRGRRRGGPGYAFLTDTGRDRMFSATCRRQWEAMEGLTHASNPNRVGNSIWISQLHRNPKLAPGLPTP